MTRIWTEGWEMQDIVGYTTYVSASASTVQKRSGSASLLLLGGTGAYASFTKSFTAISELYFRIGVRYSGAYYTESISFRKGTTSLVTITRTTGTLSISCNGLTDTGSINLTTGVWYLIEVHVKIDDATGVVEVKVDGIADCSVSGDTKGADADIDNIYLYGAYYATDSYFDDIALNDTAGGADDSWCGDGKIIMLTPNDDVTTELTQYPALTDHHNDVDDYPKDSDTTYVEGSVVDEEDKYELTASGLVAADVASINRVWCEARSKNTTANPGEVALFIFSDATEGTGTDVVLVSSYTTKVMSQEFLQDPDGPAAWSVAALDVLQGGIRTRD